MDQAASSPLERGAGAATPQAASAARAIRDLLGGYGYLYAAGVLTTIVWSSTGATQVCAFALAAALLWLRWTPELTHPLVWFIPPYALYSVSFPILCLFGFYSYDSAVQRSVAVHAVGLIAFAVPLLWDARRQPRLKVLPLRQRAADLSAVSVLICVIPIIAVGMIMVVSLGATTKRELAATGGIAALLTQTAIGLAFVSGGVLLATRMSLSRRWPAAVWVLVLIAVFALLYLGERDFIVRVAVCCVLLAWDTRRQPKMSTAIALGLAGFAVLPLLQSLKAVALGNPFSYSFEVMALFGQEFRSMGQNTWMVLSPQGHGEVHGWTAVAMELKRTFASDLLGFEGVSLTSWYNETYWGSSLAGRGFSMVGAGYLMGGAAGVAALYALAGALFAWLYRLRGVSVYRLSVYVLLVPGFIYAQRADVSNFVGPAIKSVLIPVALLAIFSEMVVSRIAARSKPQSPSGT
jgi:hypothetical protein